MGVRWEGSMFRSVFGQQAAEWGSAALVVLCGAMAGHYAQAGMTLVQGVGALVAILGSITVAVAVRVWPEESAAQDLERD